MQWVTRFFAYAVLTTMLVILLVTTALAARGQDIPNAICTCKKCGRNGADMTGNCRIVCKDKPIFPKGSEPYDYCTAGGLWSDPPPGGGTQRR